MNKLKNWVKIISVLIGTMIGAGFASGKEIYIFFAKYGTYGIIGAIVSTILTVLILYCTLLIVKEHNIKDNNEFVRKITKRDKTYMIIKNIINIFLLISFWIMSAGFCTFFKQELGVPIIVTAVLLAICIYILLMKNIEGIIKVNTFIVPIMIIIILGISIKHNLNTNIIGEVSINNSNILRAILSAIIYTSYNSITLIPIIISLNGCIQNKKDLKIVAIISSLIICILIISIFKILYATPINITNIEIPMLTILNTYTQSEKILYSIAIVAAIFTSAIASGYGILENVKNKEKYKLANFVICAMIIPISYIGFGKLVELLYPVFGVIGIGQIVLILSHTFKIKVLQKIVETDINYIEKLRK